MKYLLLFILFCNINIYSQISVSDIIKLKTNNISDEVIIKFIELKTREIENKKQNPPEIDLESYEVFQKYLKARIEKTTKRLKH